MSHQEIAPYEPAPLEGGYGEPPAPEAAAGPNLARLLLGTLRRWPTILLVCMLVAPAGLVAVWTQVKPFFTATTLVDIAPVVQPILVPDPEPVIPDFYVYLHTQAKIVTSRTVLAAALADPAVQDLPIQRSGDPVSSLYKSVTVAPVSRTQLLEISVSNENRDAALRLSRAIVNAYMDQTAGQENQSTVRRREALLRREKELAESIRQLGESISSLSQQAGTASGSVFEVRRQGVEKSITDARQRLEDLDLQIVDIEHQIKQADEGALPEDLATLREQMIDADSGVRWVKKEIDDETGKLTRLHIASSQYRAGAPEGRRNQQALEDVKKNLALLEQKLEQERERAAVMADREIQRKHQQRLQDARQRLTSVLAGLREKRDVLEQRVRARDAEGLKVNLQNMQIQTLTEQRAQARLDHERVTEALKQIETESQRPTRITVASGPEIRFDGIKDRRMKLSLVVLVLAAGMGLAAGLLRERLDPRVSDTAQVETSMGLRMLGAVPSVKELQSGAITREHFLESYRLIRASLSNLGADGNPPKSLLVTSAQAAEGKTSLAVSLAISLAEPGGRVLLVDGDIQAPQISRLLKLKPRGDLYDVLAGQRSISQCATPTGIRGLDILAGHNNGHSLREMLNGRSAREVIRQAVEEYDHVVVDSPPALGAADALVWANAVEGVIVTSLLGYSDRKAIKLACQRLLSVGARLLGSVVANVSVTESYYSYSQTSRRAEGSLALAAHNGPTHREPPLVHLPADKAGSK